MRRGNASREFAALAWKSVLHSVNQEFLQCRFVEEAARFGSLEQPCAHCALHRSMDFRWTEEEILGDLGVRGRLSPYPRSFTRTTTSWGLRCTGIAYIRYSRVANKGGRIRVLPGKVTCAG